MNRKPIVAVVAALAVIVTVFWFYRRAEASGDTAYRTATIERGDIAATVAATGALSAVTTVQVGTQVSGQVSAIFVDFNDRVRQGQLVARIDPTLQQQAVAEAQAGLERARAELQQAERNYDRNQRLYESKVITDTEFSAIEYQRSIARASMKSAEISLDRARRNLSYTEIHAPIDGIVVERNVDVGQTVAASLSAPQLFLIAQDLQQMQILANVDESDIGMIHEGQEVRFSVQTYPDERFTGRVQQVRLQSTSTENVVNYTVAVMVENPDGRLLPGMTATVDFVTASAEDVLKVPNAALRFQPPSAAGTADTQGARGAPGAQGGGAAQAGPAGRGGQGASGGAAGGARGGRPATLWRLDRATGELVAVPVTVGITDGTTTEVRGEGLQDGMEVVVGVTQGDVPSGVSSPFQQPRQQGGPGGPRGPGGF